MPSRKLRNSIIKAGALLVALVFGLILYHKVVSTNMISNMFNAFEGKEGAGFSVKEKYTEEQRDSIYNLVKGFWECNEVKNNNEYKGRLEITFHGYVWQVEETKITLPSGKITNLTHVLNGFLYPSSAGGEGENTVSVVFRYLTQLWIQDGDTCKITKYYGIGSSSDGRTMLDAMDVVVSEFKDEPAEMDLSRGLLKLFKKSYKRFASSDISGFFPEGIIDFVYNLSGSDVNISKKQYDVKKGLVTLKGNGKSDIALDPFSVRECKECKNSADFIRKSIAEDIKNNLNINKNDIVNIIKRYYEPLLMDNFFDYTIYQNTEKEVHVKVKFEVDSTGTVIEPAVDIQINNIGKKILENAMVKEIEKWTFPKSYNSNLKIEYLDTLYY